MAKLDGLLKRWPEVCAAAESPGTGGHLMRPSIEKAGPTPTDARGGRRSVRPPVDPNRWSDVVADVEVAYMRMRTASGFYALQGTVVTYRMRTGHPLDVIAEGLRLRADTVRAAYWSALKTMSRHLSEVRDDA